ncbi:unnamed protein product [Urochloa decumbens]|uniref:Fatty acyl-CoA reductase n=1 Tax=Urochloa decumbens TaxID=240449 RepID=A0ABC9CLA0_9POAL
MMISCVIPSAGCVIAATATNYRTLSAVGNGKGGHAHGRGALLPSSPLRKQHINGSATCRTRGGSSSCTGQRRAASEARPAPAASSADNAAPGIGIAEFFVGKNLLITGGTGFLAKLLIEKILRESPSVGKIYVVIKAKDTEAASKRLQSEVVDTELFKCLQEIHGEDYHGFVATKLVPVAGDITMANIGIAPKHAHEIAEEVDIIVNSAANTSFDERYDVAMGINTMRPFRLMSFAHRFRKLKLFLQVSTAYVNGERQGVVLEKPFRLGDTIASELASAGSSQHKSGAVLDIEAEIKLAFDSRRRSDDSASFTQGMKCLGVERAKLHGWQDTYVFTKAMGEMVINCMRGDIPVVTIRPSIIESTLRDPIPGWIQGNRMMDTIVVNYGKGHLSGFIADPDCILDLVPVDMVVSVMLASMAKHGGRTAAGMHVYHVGSSTSNPLAIGDLVRFFYQHFERWPVADAAGQPILVAPFRLFDSIDKFTSSQVEAASSERRRRFRAKFADQMAHLCSIYGPYTFYGGRFDSANMEKLLAEMSAEERARFNFDLRSLDWMDYVINVHIPGLRKHIMRSPKK